MTARMYYDDDADPSALAGPDGRDHRLRQPGPRPRAEPPRESGVDVVVGLAPGLQEPRAGRGGRASRSWTSPTRSRPPT